MHLYNHHIVHHHLLFCLPVWLPDLRFSETPLSKSEIGLHQNFEIIVLCHPQYRFGDCNHHVILNIDQKWSTWFKSMFNNSHGPSCLNCSRMKVIVISIDNIPILYPRLTSHAHRTFVTAMIIMMVVMMITMIMISTESQWNKCRCGSHMMKDTPRRV